MTEALPLPPGSVSIPWHLARNIETLLRIAGFLNEAERLSEYIKGAEFVAREGEKP